MSEVQSRLNEVAIADGGPAVPLAVDGLCGPLTRAAIKRFQQRYPGELINDGRIDVNKNTWKKLAAPSEGDEEASATPGLPKTPHHAAAAKAAGNAKTLALLNIALFMSRHRISEAIKALDVAANELTTCEAGIWLNTGPVPLNLYGSYQAQTHLNELPTVDRCFHIVHPKMTVAGVRDTLRRLRKVYTDMIDVIVRNNFSTAADEKSGKRRFIRPVSDRYMKRMHPPLGAIADSDGGGWWKKDANVGNIQYNSARIGDGDAITTLIHEMSHFVGHQSTFVIPGHRSGICNDAFNDIHAQAVQNSFCYE